MKITMFEIEATAEDLKASRSVAETLSMAIERVIDVFCGIGETNGEVEQEEDEVTE